VALLISTSERNVRYALGVTFVAHALNHSLTLLYPVIMVQLADLYPETTMVTLGFIGTVHYVLWGVGAIPAGWITDRLGARTVLIIYLGGAAASAFLLTLAPGLTSLAVGLAFLGIFCSLYHPAGLTLLSHHSPRLSRHMGIHGIAGSLGLTLGPLLGGILASAYGWRVPYQFFGLVALLAAVVIARYAPAELGQRPEEGHHSDQPTRFRPLVFSYMIGIFMGLAHRGTISFLPLHFSTQFTGLLDPVLIGGLLTALVLGSGIAGQILGGRLGERYLRTEVLGIVVAMNIPLLLAMFYLRGPWLIIAAIGWGVTNFAYQPIANSLIADFSSSRQRGTLFGILNGVSFGIGALASTLAGAIADQWDTAAIFLGMSMLLVPAVLVGLFMRKVKTPQIIAAN
jgi:MFS family permease